jgi:hypothetical protein
MYFFSPSKFTDPLKSIHGPQVKNPCIRGLTLTLFIRSLKLLYRNLKLQTRRNHYTTSLPLGLRARLTGDYPDQLLVRADTRGSSWCCILLYDLFQIWNVSVNLGAIAQYHENPFAGSRVVSRRLEGRLMPKSRGTFCNSSERAWKWVIFYDKFLRTVLNVRQKE